MSCGCGILLPVHHLFRGHQKKIVPSYARTKTARNWKHSFQPECLAPPMNPNIEVEITILLRSWGAGNRDAEEKLWRLVFAELKRLARRHLAHQRYDHTLQSGGLLNEVYMRLTGLKNAH